MAEKQTRQVQRGERFEFSSRVLGPRAGQMAIRLLFVFVVHAMLLVEVASVAAGSGGVHLIDGRRSGLQLEIYSQWLNGNGIRPIRLRLMTNPPRASATPRKLSVRFTPRVYNEPIIHVIDEIELPAGQRMVEKTIRIPQEMGWLECRLDVFEDGRRLDDMSDSVTGFATSNNPSDWSEMLPTILVIDSDAPSLVQRRGFVPAQYQASTSLPDPTGLSDFGIAVNGSRIIYGGPALGPMGITAITTPDEAGATFTPSVVTARQSDFLILSNLAQNPRQEIIAPVDVPAIWTELSAADFIFISLDDARLLKSQAPEKWAAIREWAGAGHSLCVYEVGEDWNRLGEISELLGSDREWLEPSAELASSGFSRLTNEFHGPDGRVGPPATSGQGGDGKFRLRPYRLGRVVAFAAADPFLDQIDFGWMLASVEPRHRSWARRFGFSRHRDNSSFTEWQIPGVGAPPVIAFLMLITVFAVAIGPLNYFWLRRSKRLHLMLVTVPLGGILATTMLLTYAILADGLHTRVRTRSFVYLDQPRQQATTWSRQTYYSGMAPSEGLVFPDSALVFPIELSPNTRYRKAGELSWIGGQSLSGAFLRSRELQQYMVVDVSANAARLDVREGDPPAVVNELGGVIERLFVRLDSGAIYESRNIAVGAERKLQALPAANLDREVRDTISRLGRLDPEIGVTYGNWQRRRWYTNVDYNAVEPAMTTSVLEQAIAAARSGRLLENRSYIAFVRNPTWLPIGVDDASREKCFDMVFGKW